MKLISILALCVCFLSCRGKDESITKEGIQNENNISIYLLKSSTEIPGLCKVNPATAVLADVPFIKNDEIISYSVTSCQFTLSKKAWERVSLLAERTNFAVTVDENVVYFGVNMPISMSSTCLHSITMHVSNTDNDKLVLQLGYPQQLADPNIEDERNSPVLVNALQKQNKLR